MHVLLMRRLLRAAEMQREIGLRSFLSKMLHRLLRASGWIPRDYKTFLNHKTRVDLLFDTENGVETSGIDYIYGLTVDGPNARFGEAHIATDPGEFRTVFESLDVDFRRFTFVDLGSGKGRAVMLAAALPFKAIVGVEFTKELHAIATANVGKLPEPDRNRISLLHGDAAAYDFPAGPLIVFFYNPFGRAIMRQVADRLACARRDSPRDILVVYLNPIFEESWVRAGWHVLRSSTEAALIQWPTSSQAAVASHAEPDTVLPA
ncbi:class I SAM-dependent methyltransferase [Lichenihabitans sp. PAMC28606]|uniref:class I SAM-dependent methyltransferase n=1 Tax=Lichenihabitans sp. PAMC28606 TaxID=2880932 RepID=UPI001D0B1893|nr:class I SAM-dependent methyltransferase [Lichenihabitans sp. PAMC28606]UDL93687.1 class I SAM-dependent methyltransferase [Lichenihabitans sp. PAMC28606]